MPVTPAGALLERGRPAVAHTQRYVSAAARLGYRHPDLTGHDRRLLDEYDREDGLDLAALDRDCALLWSAAAVADDAVATERRLAAELAGAWSGPAAQAVTDFLRRHREAAQQVAAAMRAAAAACAALRDGLGMAVAAKADTAAAIDDRVADRRPVWLAAADAVVRGPGDRRAEEVVAGEITGYLQAEIGTDWAAAMREARTAIADGYRGALDRIAATGAAGFALPGLAPAEPDPIAAVAASWPVADRPPAVAVEPAPFAGAPEPGPSPGTAPVGAGPDVPAVPADPVAAQAPGWADPAGGWTGDGASAGVAGPGILPMLGRLLGASLAALFGTTGAPGPDPDDPGADDDPGPDAEDPDPGADDPEAVRPDPGEDHRDAEPGHPGTVLDTDTDTDTAPATPADTEPGPPEPAGGPPVDPVPVAPPADGPPTPPETEPPSSTDSLSNRPAPAGPETAGTDLRTPCQTAADELPQAGA